ncbi:MAG: hypothetical protein U0872_03045 [Planctomycetaceae bacterium]
MRRRRGQAKSLGIETTGRHRDVIVNDVFKQKSASSPVPVFVD